MRSEALHVQTYSLLYYLVLGYDAFNCGTSLVRVQ